MSREPMPVAADAVALHSGDYVDRYNRKPLDRVRGLVQRMVVNDADGIADFACGNGMLWQVIGDRTGAYRGVDFSPEFIQSARAWADRSGLSQGSFHCEDIADFCADHPGEFDIATTLDFSEHVDDAMALAIYRSIRGAMRPGGRLYIHTPNLDFLIERAKQIGILRQFPEHIAVRTGPAMIDLLERAGFDRRRITVHAIPHYNLLKRLHVLSRLPLVGRYFQARLWIEARA